MPELGALAVALAALLVIFAWSLIFSRAIEAIRPHVPGLFGPLFDALLGADRAAYNSLRRWADPAVQPLTALFNRAIASIDALIRNPLAFAQAVYAAIWRLFHVEIPFAISTATANAHALFEDATARARALFDHLGGEIAALGGQLRAGLDALHRDLRSVELWALAQLQALSGLIAATAQRLEAEAAAALEQEVKRAEQVEQFIVDGVNSEVRQVVDEVTAAENAVVGFVDQQLVDLAGEVRGGLQLEHDFAQQAIKDAEQAISDLESGAGMQLLGGLISVGESLAAQELTSVYALYKQAVREEIALGKTLPAKVAPLLAAAKAALSKR